MLKKTGCGAKLGFLSALFLCLLFVEAIPCYINQGNCAKGSKYMQFIEAIYGVIQDNAAVIAVAIVFIVLIYKFSMKNTK